MKDDGFLIVFGRGVSFYRWNNIIAGNGFVFKEELIWDKVRPTSPVLPLSRRHETVSVWTKKSGKIRRSYIQYLEKKTDVEDIAKDIKRLMPVLNNPKELEKVLDYLRTGNKSYSNYRVTRFKTSAQESRNSPRCQCEMVMMRKGSLESSIIRVVKNAYKSIHPAEKPVRLLERILALVSDRGGVILDPFCGSASTCVAAMNTQRHFIGIEIDKEYYEAAEKRIAGR